ncbi:VOC family protein [Emticicia fontis]
MSNNVNPIVNLELAQIGWVVPDINAATKLLSTTLGVTGFPPSQHIRAQDLNMSYYNKIVGSDWLTTQTYHNGTFVELIQPLSGQSLFHDYLAKYPNGGIQHMAYRLPISGFEAIVNNLRQQGYEVISEVNHPIAKMIFFDTYQTLGVATEIMGMTPDGWMAIEQMKKG